VPVSGACVIQIWGRFVRYQILALIRTLFYSKPENDVHMTEMIIYDLFLSTFDHVSAAAIELHWLPVEARIQFKLCLLVHLSLIGNAPSYITDLLQPVSTRGIVLRSATQSDLQVPRTRLMFGERAFSVAAPKAWNSLPVHIRTAVNTDTFKRRLKTFLFCKFYELPLPADFM